MIVILQRAPDGLWPVLARGGARLARLPQLRGRCAQRLAPDCPASVSKPRVPRPRRASFRATAAPHATRRRHGVAGVIGATRRFGGLVAVNALSFQVCAGEIVALIAQWRRQEHVFQPDLRRRTMRAQVKSASAVSSATDNRRGSSPTLGLARTFQHVRLLPEMSVLDNVALGAHCREHPGLLRAVIGGAWRLDRKREARLLAERRGSCSASDLPLICMMPRAPSRSAGNARLKSRARCAPTPACCCSTNRRRLRHLEKLASPISCASCAPRASRSCCRTRHGLRDGTGRSRAGDGFRPEDRRRCTGGHSARSTGD